MKSLLCKIGSHKPDKYCFYRVRYHRGRHVWHRNYAICTRCGKSVGSISFHKRKDSDG